ncbi:MAG: phosphoesterase [Methanobacteriota archaeon]|nr:MAG: phosphoesterase [Euryarchaeota archaeon]
MSGPVDLHTHTTCSDGTLTPEQLVREAKRLGLVAVGITDHDTLGGVAEAWRAGDRLGVEVVPGVEISVDPPWGDRELHLLGYYVKENEELESKLRWARGARERRNLRIIEELVGLGMDISYEEVKRLAGGDVVGRPHIARLLVEKGYVKSFEEAFLRYLARGGEAYTPKERLGAEEGITLILRSGGVPVWAHPIKSGYDPSEVEKVLEWLVSKGLRGIEVYTPDHTPKQVEHLKSLAKKRGLIITGGSDYHGPGKNSHGKLGLNLEVPYETVLNLKKG